MHASSSSSRSRNEHRAALVVVVLLTRRSSSYVSSRSHSHDPTDRQTDRRQTGVSESVSQSV
eukprot:scaffold260666_cov28-Attheya_sp.AAC.1